jgi:hypothetical protein
MRVAIVCENAECPMGLINALDVSCETEKLFFESFGQGGEDPADHCPVCKQLATAKPWDEYTEPEAHLREKQDMLTWLNGRADKIMVHHDGELMLLWSPEDATSIEDMLAAFCKRHGIDMAEEIGG